MHEMNIESVDVVKSTRNGINNQSIGEEIANGITHGLGALLGVAALIICTVRAVMYGTGIGVVSAVLYGVSLVLLYTFSSLYHSITHRGAKKVLRIMDHCTIFLLILGTYIPISLVLVGGALGWVLFGINAMCMVVGVIFNSIDLKRWAKLSLLLYILMGWSVLVSIVSVVRELSVPGLVFLFGGGMSYMVGVLFYIRKNRKYMHVIWHLFVLGGSIMHFFLIAFYCFPTV